MDDVFVRLPFSCNHDDNDEKIDGSDLHEEPDVHEELACLPTPKKKTKL